MTFSFEGCVDIGDSVEHLAKHGDMLLMQDVVVAEIGGKVVAASHGGVHASSGNGELGLGPG
tara:strand:+ start:27370 stop:27555 length:186 start_codon:yes stop_codon:yes gene_type:complete